LAAHPELLSYWPNSLKKIGRYYAFRDCPAIASHLAAPFLAMVLGVGIVFWGITAMGGPLGWLTLFSEIPSQAIVAAFVYLIWSGLCCSLLIKYWVTPYPRPIMVLCGLGAATTIHAIYIGSVFLSNLSLSVIMAMLLMLGLLLLPRITGMRPLWLFLILPFLAWHSLLSIGAVDYFALSTMTTKAHHANPQTAATLTSNAPAEPLNAVREDLAPMEADHANSIPDATVQQHPLLTETKEIQQTPGAMTDETRAVKLIARIDSALTAGKWEEAGPLVDELTAIPDATLSASTKLRLIAISDKYRNPPNPNSPAVAIPAGDKSTPAAVGSDNSPKALPMPTEDMETRAVTQDKISTPPALAPMPEPAALPAPMPAPPVAAKDAQPSPNAQVGPAKATAAQQQTQLLPGAQQATLTPPGATGNTAPSPKTSAVMAAVISVEQARLLHNSGKTAEALQMLSVITSSEAKALAAEIAIEQTVAKKDYATAEAQAKAYIATWPKSSIGYRWLAEILSDGYNDITSSLDMASTALALAPDNTSAFITRGNTKLKLSPPDLDGAETDYRKALSLARQKEGIAAHNGLGLVYLQRSRISAQKDNLDLARSSFRMALASDPQNPHSLQGMALIDAEEGLFSSAFAQINQAIAIAPENAEQYRTRATIATAAHARDELKTHPLCSAVAIFHDYASYIDRLSKTAHGGTPVDLWPIIATWGAAGIEAEDENADFLATATRVANVFSRHFQTLPDAFFTDKNGAGLLWKKVAMRLPGSELKRLLLSKDFAKDFTFRSDLLRRNSRGSVSSALYREIQTDNAVAMYYLGQHFKYAPPPDEKMCLAFEWFSKAAQKGLVEAQYEVALCYESGHGVANNQQLATSWYMTAAEAGYAEAQFRVADRYCTGTFVPQSYATGAAWLEKAAKQGHVPAIAALADLYYTGDGVGKDMERSFALATIAATNYDLRGQFRLATLNYTGEGIQKDMEKAIPLMQQCAQEGYPLAQYQLGLMYHNGEVTGKKDISKAIFWYKKAAAQGHAKAITALKSLSHAHAEVGSPRPK